MNKNIFENKNFQKLVSVYLTHSLYSSHELFELGLVYRENISKVSLKELSQMDEVEQLIFMEGFYNWLFQIGETVDRLTKKIEEGQKGLHDLSNLFH